MDQPAAGPGDCWRAGGEHRPGGGLLVLPDAEVFARRLPAGPARELLASAGIEFPPARRVSDLQEARAAAEELGYPVVVKALGLLHKSDAGGVALGIEDELGLGEALARMATLQSEQYSVERMAPVHGVHPSDRIRHITIWGSSPGMSGMSCSTGIRVLPRTTISRSLAKYSGTTGMLSAWM